MMNFVGPILHVARQRAFEHLRNRDAVSYAVEVTRIRVGGCRALHVLSADAAEGADTQVFDELVSILDDLASSGPAADELEAMRGLVFQTRIHPQNVLEILDSSADRHLLGLPVMTPEELDTFWADVSRDQLRDDLASIMPTLLAIGPRDLEGDVKGWNEYGVWSSDSLAGHVHRPISET